MLDPKVASVIDAKKLDVKIIECDPDFADTAQFCEKYGYSPGQSANTILVANKKDQTKLVACVVLATTRLDVNKKVCQLMGTNKASFASAEQTVAATGMMIGGVVAVGITDLPIYVDSAVMEQSEILMGGGNRSSKIVLSPQELEKLPNVTVVDGLAKRPE